MRPLQRYIKPLIPKHAVDILSLFYSIIAIALAITIGHSAAFAQSVCYEPIAPFCMEPSTNFDSDAVRGRCETDIQDYIEKIDEYVGCLESKVENARGDKEAARTRSDEIKKIIE